MLTSKFNDNLENLKILWHSIALASPPTLSSPSLVVFSVPVPFSAISTAFPRHHHSPHFYVLCFFFFKSQCLVLSCSHQTEGYTRHQRWCMFFLSTTWRWDTGEDRVCCEELTDLGPGWFGKGQHSLLRGKEKWLGGANGLAQERVKRPGGASGHVVHEW